METLNNPKPIQEIVETLPKIKDKIDKTINEMRNYLEFLGDERFNERPNEKEDDAIKRAESIFNCLVEIIQRRKSILKNGQETIELIAGVKNKMENVMKSCRNDGIHLKKANNEIIDKIIELEERKIRKELQPLQNQIDLINHRFINKKNDWDNQRIICEEPKEGVIGENIKKRLNNVLKYKQIRQIEEWTQMKIGNVIFDSSIDDWKQDTSVFDQRILNKSNLIFLIQDNQNNLFGGYISALINTCNDYINDPKSFVFSLKSNGRLSGMVKFVINIPHIAFYLTDKADNFNLFQFGHGKYGSDISVCKENNKNKSYCIQTAFNYGGHQNAFCGITTFAPLRITVIQLI